GGAGTRNSAPPGPHVRCPLDPGAREGRRRSSDELQNPEALRFLTVPAQVDPPVPAAPHQLATAALAAGLHFVDEQIEPQPTSDVRALPLGPRDRDGHAIAAGRTSPPALHRLRRAW